MDNYFEQSVAGDRGPRERLAYGISWAAVVMLALAAFFFAANLVLLVPTNGGFNWLALVLMVVCAALAFVIFRMKDGVYREYDYILWNGELEIHIVYNHRRRKKLTTIQLGKVTAWGPVPAMESRMGDARKRFWCIRPMRSYCLIYPGESEKTAAFVELSSEMCAQIRNVGRSLREAEVKP